MSKPLKPFFSYFGSKYTLSKKYYIPTKEVLIEPFAGSACYSLHYPHKQVKLYDKYDVICGIWDYLIHVSEKEILELPLIDFDKSLDDYDICQEAKWLIGFWIRLTHTKPGKKHSSRSLLTMTGYIDKNGKIVKPRKFSGWNEANKQKIASQVKHIRHWTIEQKSYEDIENENATWFVDPPYQLAGKNYTESSKNIDFTHLANWCTERQGEVIVCENVGASWMPFKDFSLLINHQGRATHEVVYYQGFNESQLSLFGDEQK